VASTFSESVVCEQVMVDAVSKPAYLTQLHFY